MTLDDQLQFFDRKCDNAYARCLRDFKARKPAIIAEARRRLIEGYDLYGDQMFHRSYMDLREAELQEAADMLNYRLGTMRQGWT